MLPCAHAHVAIPGPKLGVLRITPLGRYGPPMSTDGVYGPEGPKRPTPTDLEVSSRLNLTELEEQAATLTPSQAQRLLRGMARIYVPLAIATLVDICKSRRNTAAARAMAAALLLERAVGKEDVFPTAPANPGKSGVMLIPQGKGKDEWEQQANEHHKKALEAT